MRENEKPREKNFYKLLKCIVVNNMHMDSNPTAPMVREANRGAVIPSAGGERGLGQEWVCWGLIWSPLPRDLCQILSKSRYCALCARAFTSLNQSLFQHGRLGQSYLPVDKLLSNRSEAKADWVRGGC